MKVSTRLIFHYLLFFTTALLLLAIQCTLWFQVFGGFAAPQLWTILFAYWILNRSLIESVFTLYFLAGILAPFTALPFGILLLLLNGTLVLTLMFKSRIFWLGPTYFLLFVGVINITFPILHMLCAWLIEKHPILRPEIFDWLLSTLITTLMAYPILQICQLFDRIGERESRHNQDEILI